MNVIIETISYIGTSGLILIGNSYGRYIISKSKVKKHFMKY
jgi:hypothetical protein